MSIQTFAGFALPRTSNGPTIYRPEQKPLSFRLAEFKRHGRGAIGQVTYPDRIRTVETAATFTGWGTYVPVDGSDIMGLRWSYIDDVPSDWAPDGEWPRRIGHEGYYMDADFDGGDMARGVILKLPAGRGYLYGWAMGAGMVASISSDRCDDINDAISWADDEARQAAENERDYRENHCFECGEHVDDCTCSDEDEDSSDNESLIPVYFRVFDAGDVIALWRKPWGGDKSLITSYQHDDQHSGASAALIEELRPASYDEKAALLSELESLGYDVVDADSLPVNITLTRAQHDDLLDLFQRGVDDLAYQVKSGDYDEEPTARELLARAETLGAVLTAAKR